jgi:uncharacterized protein YbjT (DUF2867 family)
VILVTGATGTTGGELVRLLAETGAPARATDEVATLTGRQPRNFAQFAAEHRAIFGGQQ